MKEELPRWNLSSLFKDKEEAKNALVKLQDKISNFITACKGKLNAFSPQELFEVIQEYEHISEVLGRVGSYAYLIYATNLQNDESLAFYQFVSETISELSAQIIFFSLDLNELNQEIILAPALAPYLPFLRQNRVFKPYQLTKPLEELLSRKSITSTEAWVRFYNETMAGMKFNFKDQILSLAEILNKLSSTSGADRELASKELGKVLSKNIKTFVFIYNIILKDKQIEDEYRGFKNPIDYRNTANFIEKEVVESLINTVKENYADVSHRYYKIKAKIFGVSSLKYWDRNAPLPFNNDISFTYKQAKEITLESYHNFHPQMSTIAEKFFENNWIDADVYHGKDSGAFSHSTVPSANPFIMLNFMGKARDISTMAHELGHGIHQYLARKQGALMCNTPLTLAETASIFGEQLVFQKLLTRVKTKEERLSLLGSKIEDMINTVVRQIAFCQFENILHDQRKEGEISAEQICKTWLKVQKNSLGEGISFEDEYKNYWAYISHFFHAPFYVYAYPFGDCLVNSLYSIYQKGKVENFEEKYLDMLEKGGTLHHSELLAPFNINLTDKSFWQEGLSILKNYIDEFESLL